jgi:hypothetical protein
MINPYLKDVLLLYMIRRRSRTRSSKYILLCVTIYFSGLPYGKHPKLAPFIRRNQCFNMELDSKA